MSASPLDRLRDAAIRVQLPVVLVTVPITTGLYALAVVPWVNDIVLEQAGVTAAAAATRATWIAVGTLLGCVLLATTFAAMLLRGSIRAAVGRLQGATDAIARGEFRHRIRSERRDELGQLAASIDAMAERLERLEQARRRVLACVSHELRTPLTIIQGTAFTLGRREADAVERVRLDLIQAEAMRLARLVDDLIDTASLHAGGVRLDVERCDIVGVVRDQVMRFGSDAADRGLEIRVDAATDRAVLDIDPDRIGQVLANVLSNAIRHAIVGTEIAVGIAVDARAGTCRICVANTCQPLEPEVVRHIFEPFVQGAAHTGSVGLGLAIVEALVAAHGGSVRVDEAAALAGLARFTIDLPMPPRSAGHAPATLPARRVRATTVLAADA